jgi:hypothetical protein
MNVYTPRLHILGKGYCPLKGGIYITQGNTPPDVPLPEALRSIVRIYEDFDFLTWGDRLRTWGWLIGCASVMGKLVDEHAPIHLVRAQEVGSGKTYLQDLTAAVFGETPYLAPNKAKGAGGLDESLAEGMSRGHPMIKIDNLDGKFDSQYLESLLTADRAPARVLYRRELEVDPRRHFFFVNPVAEFTISPGLLRRCYPIQIRKRPLNFGWNRYREGDILKHVRANQSYYLGCVFAVIKEWHRLGKPHTPERRHSFTRYTQNIDWIIQNIFKVDLPMFCDHDGHGNFLPTISRPDGEMRSPFES